MEKYIICGIIALFILAFIPSKVVELQEISATTVNVAQTDTDESEVLLTRLNEIREIDRSAISRSEQMELRNEVREINEKINNNNRVVFLSVATLLLAAILFTSLL